MSRTDAPIRLPQQLPAVMQRLIATQQAIGEAETDATLHHLVVLRASQLNQCGFCVKMHAAEARAGGETNARLDHLAAWRHVGDYSARERAALAWTEALTRLDPAADLAALRSELRVHFDEAELAALTATIAMINLWNRVQIASH
ncbi:carboxymuconolactone decarboxylase family protein [Chiayiivirga flava]|uniref:AhpD family alkylhydroperoxidase n=1 Tax=Chiayiivirga flava TaxID=659595 RepID=A0A7W8G0P6_9GAMM|nr:carboxymuconolactone decarboxylase family protein [Chiayiivirga flava]MBB5206870.1 AhpD family alkylhydroperoxidase [Chiayiivirga flava]